VEMGYCTDQDICNALSQILGSEPTAIDAEEIDTSLVKVVPDSVSKQWGLIPLKMEDKVLTVAMSNPMDVKAIDELTVFTGFSINPLLALKSEITKAILFLKSLN